MTTATKNKVESNGAAAVAKVIQEREQLESHACDLAHKLSRGEELSASDYGVFGIVGWSDDDLEREVNRWRKRHADMEIAGTKAIRTKARKAANQAQDKLATEGGEIEQQIAKLQSQLESLQADATAKETIVADQEAACARLRANLPKSDEMTAKRLESQIKKKFHPLISPLELRQKLIEDLSQKRWSNPLDTEHRNLLIYAERHAEHCIEPGRGLTPRIINSERWQAYIAELQDEQVGLVNELSSLKEEREKDMQAVETIRNKFCR